MKRSKRIAILALLLALTVILSLIPLRVSSATLALTLLPVFSPAAIWGVTVGCLLTNLIGVATGAVLPMDISITRIAVADTIKDGKVEDYLKSEAEKAEDKLRTMGRKQLIPFGLYEVRGFISANLAAETGFDEDDLKALFEAILNMYEHDHSASKGEMSVVSPLIVFKHVGTDTDEAQRTRQAKLGCAPAHKLFELVHVQKKAGVEVPRSYRDYDAAVDIGHVPAGVEIGFQRDPYGPVCWGELPAGEDWFRLG